MMKYSAIAYPAGSAGVGLVMLRVSLAASITVHAFGDGGQPLWGLTTTLALALAITLGGFTRVVAVLAAIVSVLTLIQPSGVIASGLVKILTATALAMLGPGAYSIDGLRFGRRTIRLAD